MHLQKTCSGTFGDMLCVSCFVRPAPIEVNNSNENGSNSFNYRDTGPYCSRQTHTYSICTVLSNLQFLKVLLGSICAITAISLVSFMVTSHGQPKAVPVSHLKPSYHYFRLLSQ